MIATPGKPTGSFYKVVLDGAHPPEPLWFAYQEVALIGTACDHPAECELCSGVLVRRQMRSRLRSELSEIERIKAAEPPTMRRKSNQDGIE
jgi:hypothetical protein